MTYVPWVLLLLVGNKPSRPRYDKKRIKIGIRLVVCSNSACLGLQKMTGAGMTSVRILWLLSSSLVISVGIFRVINIDGLRLMPAQTFGLGHMKGFGSTRFD